MTVQHVRRSVVAAVAALAVAALAVVALAVAGPASAAPSTTGDVFLSVSGSPYVKEESPAGNLVAKYSSPVEHGDLAIDSRGYLLVDSFRKILQFDPQGQYAGVFADTAADGLPGVPGSITIDAAGHVLVGGDSLDINTDEATVVREYDTAGTLIDHFPLRTDKHAVPYIDLAADQCSLRYTVPGYGADRSTVQSYDVCTHRQQPVVAKLPERYTLADAVRALPGSDGALLVAVDSRILLLDPAGHVTRTYHPGPVYSGSFNRVSLDPDGTSFWTTDDLEGFVYRVRLSDGKTLGRFHVRARVDGGDHAFFGLAVSGEPTAARPGWLAGPAGARLRPVEGTADRSYPALTVGAALWSHCRALIRAQGKPVEVRR